MPVSVPLRGLWFEMIYKESCELNVLNGFRPLAGFVV